MLNSRIECRGELKMDLLLVIIVLFVIFGGGGWYGRRSGWWGGSRNVGGYGSPYNNGMPTTPRVATTGTGFNPMMIILVIVILFLLFSGFGYYQHWY